MPLMPFAPHRQKIVSALTMGWTTGTFTVSGWSGRRERVALLSGPVIATTGLASLTVVALLVARQFG